MSAAHGRLGRIPPCTGIHSFVALRLKPGGSHTHAFYPTRVDAFAHAQIDPEDRKKVRHVNSVFKPAKS